MTPMSVIADCFEIGSLSFLKSYSRVQKDPIPGCFALTETEETGPSSTAQLVKNNFDLKETVLLMKTFSNITNDINFEDKRIVLVN